MKWNDFNSSTFREQLFALKPESGSTKKKMAERVFEKFFLVFFKNSQGYTWKLKPFWFE